MEYISREAVNDLIEDIRNNHFILMSDRVTLLLLKSKVAEIPTADVQPVDRWISVDERLPKTGESVLVYVAINENLKGFGECKPEIRIGWLDDGDKWALQFSNMNYSEVLCWMPLPEPPKDGDT